jgi:hypothetical protein
MQLVIVCTSSQGTADSYIVQRSNGDVKWIGKPTKTDFFFDDLSTSSGMTTSENTVYLDAMFDYVVHKRGISTPPEVLITFQGRRVHTLVEWKRLFQQFHKIKHEMEIKDWALRLGASGLYIKGKSIS